MYYNLHTHRTQLNTEITALVNQYPWEFTENIFPYSIGIHPWYIDENRLEKDLELIEIKLIDENCLALGECGLDKRIAIDFDLQKEVFERQIDLVQKHQKPLVIHCVAAFQELIEIKNKKKITVPIIIHGFSKNNQLANQLITNGFYLSFGKYLLRNPELKDVFLAIPNEKIFLETDTIEETIAQVYTKAADYKGISIESLKEIIAKNWIRVFTRK